MIVSGQSAGIKPGVDQRAQQRDRAGGVAAGIGDAARLRDQLGLARRHFRRSRRSSRRRCDARSRRRAGAGRRAPRLSTMAAVCLAASSGRQRIATSTEASSSVLAPGSLRCSGSIETSSTPVCGAKLFADFEAGGAGFAVDEHFEGHGPTLSWKQVEDNQRSASLRRRAGSAASRADRRLHGRLNDDSGAACQRCAVPPARRTRHSRRPRRRRGRSPRSGAWRRSGPSDRGRRRRPAPVRPSIGSPARARQ